MKMSTQLSLESVIEVIRTRSQEVGEKMAKTGHWTLRISYMNSGTTNWSNIGSWLRYTLENFSSKIPIWIPAETFKIQSYEVGTLQWHIEEIFTRIHMYVKRIHMYVQIINKSGPFNPTNTKWPSDYSLLLFMNELMSPLHF